MTLVRRTTTPLRRIAPFAVALSLAAPLATAASVLTATEVAEAGPRLRSSSEDVAARAVVALDALRAWESDGDPSTYLEYLSARDRTAELAAAELQLDAEEMVRAWATTHPSKQVALLGALSQLGVPYRTRTSEPGVGFDCSGLTTYAWSLADVALTRSSGDQLRAAQRVERDDAVAGDFVHYPGHIMMYLGLPDAVVHSPNTGNLVEITFVSDRRSATVTYADPLVSS